MNELTLIDLFSGIGGFSLAGDRAGFRTVCFSEVDPCASAVLRKHWPDVPNLGDITKADFGPYAGATVLCGGFPCQPFSVAGKRRGKADDRFLWPSMLAAIQAARPTWVVAENVTGIIRMELDRVLADLEGIGYSGWPLVIPACAVDAKHRRNRVWIVANSRGGRLGQQVDGEVQFAGRAEAFRPGETMAHADIVRGREEPGALPGTEGKTSLNEGRRGRAQPGDGSEALPNTNSTRLEERGGESGNPGQERTTAERGSKGDRCQWPAEPGVGRVAHGIPSRVDRIKALGNSIVPQVAEQILRGIAAIERGE